MVGVWVCEEGEVGVREAGGGVRRREGGGEAGDV